MMDQSVNDRHRDIVIKEKFTPVGKFLVGGQNNGSEEYQGVSQ